MKKEPLVSVIIPNYNHALFLEERIESVLNQTFQDFEIILLDDHSKDSSLEILYKYKKHPKIRHFEVNTINSGSVFKQWVKGINLAKSKYTWIAESDDVAHPEFLEKMINFAEQKDNLGLVFCKSIIIDEKSNKIGEKSSFKKKYIDFKIIGCDLVSEFLIKQMVVPNASSVLFLSEAIEEIDFNKLVKFKNTGDRFTYIQIGFKRCIFYIDNFLNYNRIHDSNTTKKNVANFAIYRDRLNIVNGMILECSESALASKNLLEFYLNNIFFMIRSNSGKKNQKVLFKLYKYSYLDRNSLLKFSFLNLITLIFKGSLPHFIRVNYKSYIFSKFDVQI